ADLRAPEFTVTVDGKPRRIVSAEYVSLRGPAREVGRGESGALTEVPEQFSSSNATIRRGRMIVIAVDRDTISFGNGRDAMRAAGKFLDKLGPSDRVAFITVPPPGPAVDFTANHELVRKVLDRTVGVSHRIRGRYNIGVYEAFSIVDNSDDMTANTVYMRLCVQFVQNASAFEDCVLEVRNQAGEIVALTRERNDASIRTLVDILSALKEIDGPKSLVWISEGLTIDGPGAELTEINHLAADA